MSKLPTQYPQLAKNYGEFFLESNQFRNYRLLLEAITLVFKDITNNVSFSTKTTNK